MEVCKKCGYPSGDEILCPPCGSYETEETMKEKTRKINTNPGAEEVRKKIKEFKEKRENAQKIGEKGKK